MHKRNIYSFIIWTAVCFAVFALALSPFRLVAYIVPVIMLAYFMPSTRYIDTFFLKLASSFIFMSCLQIVFGAVFWFLKFEFGLPAVVFLETFSVAIFTLKYGKSQKINWVSKEDVLAILLAGLTICIVLVSVLGHGAHLPQLLRYVTTGFDNTTHVSMTMSDYKNNGFIYGRADDVTEKLVYRDFTTYPQGWHLNSSILWHAVDSNLSLNGSSITKVLSLYLFTLLLWYGLIVYMFSRVTGTILKLLRGDSNTNLSLIEVVAVTGFNVFTQIALLLGMLRYGFASFLPVLLYGLMVILVVLHAAARPANAAKKIQTQPNVMSVITLLSLLSAGLSFSWLLAVPIAAVPAFLLLFEYFDLKPKKLLTYIGRYWQSILIILLLVSICFIQLLIQIKFNQKTGQLNEDGAIGKAYPTLILISFLTMIATLSGKISASKETVRRTFVFAIPGVILLMAFVYFYQYYTAGALTYYSTKTALIGTLLLLVFFCAVAVKYIVVCANGMSKPNQLVLVFCAPLLLVVATGLDTGVLSHTTGRYRKLSNYSAQQVADLVSQNKAQSANVVVFKELDYEEDLVTTHFLKMLSRRDPECQRVMIYFMLSGQRDKLIPQIDSCASDTRFYVVASNKNFDELTSRFGQNNNITVLLSN